MDKQLAGFAIEFMVRVQLTGAEARIFHEVMLALEGIAKGENAAEEISADEPVKIPVRQRAPKPKQESTPEVDA